MKYSSRYYAKLLYQATDDVKGDKLKEALSDFIKLLVRRRALKQLPLIVAAFEHYYNRQKGIVPVIVTTANSLSLQEYEQVAQTMAGVTNATVELTKNVDATLRGGMTIQYNGLLVDGSVRGYLTQLAASLKSTV